VAGNEVSMYPRACIPYRETPLRLIRRRRRGSVSAGGVLRASRGSPKIIARHSLRGTLAIARICDRPAADRESGAPNESEVPKLELR